MACQLLPELPVAVEGRQVRCHQVLAAAAPNLLQPLKGLPHVVCRGPAGSDVLITVWVMLATHTQHAAFTLLARCDAEHEVFWCSQ